MPLVLCAGGFCFTSLGTTSASRAGQVNVVWQKEKYISNLVRQTGNPTCCLAKREIYFQFPRAPAAARECCLAKFVLHLPNNIGDSTVQERSLTKL